MTNRLLLESGTDGYLLEDGSGILLDEATTNFLEIASQANTTVTYQGGGTYRIAKTGGSDGSFDASAVSSAGLAGDFVLRIGLPVLPPGGEQLGHVGLNSDPTTDNNFTGIDFGAIYFEGSWTIYESGADFNVFAHSTYLWIRRTGTTLEYLSGADLGTATLRRSTTSSATLYFDSSIQDSTQARVDVLFYEVLPEDDLVGSASVAFSATGTLAGAGALVGASSPAFTTAGTLRGAGALSGASTVAFSTSATGQLVGILSGSSTAAFTTTGGIAGAGALAGASSATFAPAGVLMGSGALTGAVTGTFAAAGILTGSAPLSGSVAATFAPVGALQGIVYIFGVTSLGLSASGTLTGREYPQATPLGWREQSKTGSWSGYALGSGSAWQHATKTSNWSAGANNGGAAWTKASKPPSTW